MAIVLASTGTLTTSNGTDSNSPGAPSGVTAGDLLVAVAIAKNGAGFNAVSGWTAVDSVATSSQLTAAYIFYRVADGGANDSPTFTFSTSQTRKIMLLRFTGAATSSPYDTGGNVGQSASDTVSSRDTPALTIAENNSVMIGIIVNDAARSTTWVGTAFTEIFDEVGAAGAISGSAGYRLVPSGSYAGGETVTLSGSDNRVGLVVSVFKPAVGGGIIKQAMHHYRHNLGA